MSSVYKKFRSKIQFYKMHPKNHGRVFCLKLASFIYFDNFSKSLRFLPEVPLLFHLNFDCHLKFLKMGIRWILSGIATVWGATVTALAAVFANITVSL